MELMGIMGIVSCCLCSLSPFALASLIKAIVNNENYNYSAIYLCITAAMTWFAFYYR